MRVSDIKKMSKTRKILKIGNITEVLTKKEYRILCLRFGVNQKECYTLRQIGWRYKQPPYTIGRIEKRALQKVEEYIEQLRGKSNNFYRHNWAGKHLYGIF